MVSALGTVTATEIVPRTAAGSSQPNLPGFYPAVYPKRLMLKRLDCLSRTRHPLGMATDRNPRRTFPSFVLQAYLCKGCAWRRRAAAQKAFRRGKQHVSSHDEAECALQEDAPLAPTRSTIRIA